ncbi:hypothetical protein SAMN05446927_6542 [Caballeronia arationis]|uniref:Uncharacterized protein n=2 Tax=Caballeronia arationis TaxID=1777142 RepID=A0A7Z7ID25_9BURK|nr:hypothetical protein SAMN05446927_6542 [Caballeronia arationis]
MSKNLDVIDEGFWRLLEVSRSGTESMISFRKRMKEVKKVIHETEDRDAATAVVTALNKKITDLTKVRDGLNATLTEVTEQLVSMVLMSAERGEIATHERAQGSEPALIQLHEAGLSMESWRRLYRIGVVTVSDALKYSESAFLSVLEAHCAGQEPLLLIARIKKLGFSFPMESEYAEENLQKKLEPNAPFDLRLTNRLKEAGVEDAQQLLDFYKSGKYPMGIAGRSLSSIKDWLVQNRLITKA